MDIKIIVAAHKQYWMPDDPMYIPLQVGAEGKMLDLKYLKDNQGENISCKNTNYCELTGLYWVFKNFDADYIGFVHYRRYFSNGKFWGSKKKRIITQSELEKQIIGEQILLPKPRNYYIETIYSQYAHAHHAIDLDIAKQIISEKYPEYITMWDKVMSRTKVHLFNMFIMKRERLREYCTWLFDILFELEKRLDISNYNKYDSRVFGFVSERLLDIWIETNGYKYKEIPYVFMENQNWIIKIGKFLKRKITQQSK